MVKFEIIIVLFRNKLKIMCDPFNIISFISIIVDIDDR